VVSVPTSAGFTFAYGPASFARHVAEAERLDLPLRVERSQRLGWDVDLPDDLVTPDWLAS
jgi:2-phospho-L-lactate guanylyltransferase (CobY/MobA/RfbA family)